MASAGKLSRSESFVVAKDKDQFSRGKRASVHNPMVANRCAIGSMQAGMSGVVRSEYRMNIEAASMGFTLSSIVSIAPHLMDNGIFGWVDEQVQS